jgi:hypothetical protein
MPTRHRSALIGELLAFILPFFSHEYIVLLYPGSVKRIYRGRNITRLVLFALALRVCYIAMNIAQHGEAGSSG